MNPFAALQDVDEKGDLTRTGRTRQKKREKEAQAAALAKQQAELKLKQEIAAKKAAAAKRRQEEEEAAARVVATRLQGARNRLTGQSFTTRQRGATYVRDLDTTVTWNKHILHAHLTIDKEHLSNAAAAADDVQGVFATVAYHVTFAEGPNLSDKNNPRWRSTSGWDLKGEQVGMDGEKASQDILLEAEVVMAALRR